jgi:phosphatidylinositol glycan class S
MERIAETLSTIIPPVYLGQYENLGNIACHIEKKDKNDVASMRVLKYSSQYETTFSLMNNNPENKRIDWEIREAVQSYLTPFLKEISVVSNFTIDSQVRRYYLKELKCFY